MNSIFRKTLIASSLSVILSTAAIAEDDYKTTIDGTTADEKQLNSQQDNSSKYRSESNQNYQETIDGKKAPCNDDMKDHNQSKNQDMDKGDAEDRPLTEHQGNVTNQNSDTSENYKSQNRDMEQRDAEDRPVTKHQDSVTEEEEEEEEVMPGANDEQDNGTEIEYSDDSKQMDSSEDTEMNIQMEEATDSSSEDNAITSPASNLYSMSADELIGMNVVANDDEEIGYVSNIVLSPDQSEVHAVITVGSILGMGGRDILASLDELTQVNDELRIDANKDDIAAMSDYGSEDFIELEGDAALSTAIRVKE